MAELDMVPSAVVKNKVENVEKAIARIMADKVYTSAEFKRERDNFHVSTIDL